MIGLNPSTADKDKSDRTITRVRKYSEGNFDGFFMINLSAQRTPHPSDLSQQLDSDLRDENLLHIKEMFSSYPAITILAAWGNNINRHPYLRESLKAIVELTLTKEVTWKHIGPHGTKMGQPRHPGRGAYQELQSFSIRDYLSNNLRPPGP